MFNGKNLVGWKLPTKAGNGNIDVVSRMDGRTTVGYIGIPKDGKKKENPPIRLWQVENGILIGSGAMSHLFTERSDFTNFVFRVEAQINERGNSGMYFRTDFGPGFPRGYEAQICAGPTDVNHTGGLYIMGANLTERDRNEITVTVSPHRPDEWFTQEVTVIDNRITVKVNDRVTVYWTDVKRHYSRGHLGLQVHNSNSTVKFRKIEVMELK